MLRRLRAVRVASLAGLLASAALAVAGCSSYSSALGYRARQAVLHHDITKFQDLMEEAADADPKGPHDNPKKTVLTHFLDLAGDPSFFSYIDAWRKKGWVADDMTCSIYRAHYRENRVSNPAAAKRSAEMCVKTARAAANDPDKGWQIDDCFDGASFLTETATRALVPFVRVVADPSEPLKLRTGLMSGMTDIPVSGTQRHLDNDSSLTKAQAEGAVEGQLFWLRARFQWIVDAARPYLDLALLAGSTAIGAMRIEYASNSIGQSYVGRFARAENQDDNDLAWAWVRSAKNKKAPKDIEGLGLWNKDRETKGDVFWYLCTRPGSKAAAPGSAASAIGPIEVLDAISVRTSSKVADLEALRIKRCVEKPGAEPYPEIAGPFPAETIARGSVAEAHAPGLVAGVEAHAPGLVSGVEAHPPGLVAGVEARTSTRAFAKNAAASEARAPRTRSPAIALKRRLIL